MSEVVHQFLPWVRRGLGVAITTQDTSGIPARAEAVIGVHLDGAASATSTLRVQLYGPGDVVGIDTSLVVRTDPKPNTTNFEPNYLALVEFDNPDYPWLLTPAIADAAHRLRPWLVLLVLDRQKVAPPSLRPNAPLPSIVISRGDAAKELPPLSESWSWAHAQWTAEVGKQAEFAGDPTRTVSRLLSPRRLAPDKSYLACLVPAFEQGRMRGLGLDMADAPTTLEPAWATKPAADVVLPVYDHWEFSTGAVGDFESLARRLRTPKELKGTAKLGEVGTAWMSTDPLIGTPDKAQMEGVLLPLSYTPGANASATHAAKLAESVSEPATRARTASTPSTTPQTLAPPIVGRWHARRHTVGLPDGSGPSPRWLDELNTNPRHRAAAGYGAEVVRAHQEELMDECWAQAGDLFSGNTKLNFTRLAIDALRALKTKHFDPLPDERILQLMGPALARLESLPASGPGFRLRGKLASLGAQLARSSLPAALTDAAFRRQASPVGRVLRPAARRAAYMKKTHTLTTDYLSEMAKADARPAAFAVNRFVPGGLGGTSLFDGVALNGPDTALLDLRARGFGQKVTVKRAKALANASARLRAQLAQALPTFGPVVIVEPVFVDRHVDRFHELSAAAPGVGAADWTTVSQNMTALARKGAQGVLIESNAANGRLHISALEIDNASGRLGLDAKLAGHAVSLDAQRKPIAGPAPAPNTLAKLNLGGGAGPSAAALLSAVPVGSISTTRPLASGPNAPATLELKAGLLRALQPAPAAPTAVAVAIPALLGSAEARKRFKIANDTLETVARDPYAAAKVEVKEVAFGVATAGQIIRLRTAPSVTVGARLASTASVGGAALNKNNTALAATWKTPAPRVLVAPGLDRMVACPDLPTPLYRWLASHDREAFMPGVGGLPDDLVMLVQVNQAFIDSFMAGANDEMNREMLWRGFPTDQRGTPFRHFWEGGATIEAMHRWQDQPLGRCSTPSPGAGFNRVALLIRGRLLQRFPNTLVYAWKRRDTTLPATAEDQLDKTGDITAKILPPTFGGTIAPDTSFHGFDIPDTQIAEWCFVLEEPMGEPRFGFDVDGPPTPRVGPKRRAVLAHKLTNPGLNFNAYKALTWAPTGVPEGGFVTMSALESLPQAAALGTQRHAGTMAKALLQLPFRAYFVGSRLDS